MSFEVKIDPDPGPDIARLAELYGSRTVYEAIGASAAEASRLYLADRDRRPNKSGFPKQHFWEKIARGTREEVDDQGVSIVFPSPMTAKVMGVKEMKPTGGKTWLTIPMVAAAYGKRAREFSNLEFAVVPGVGPSLVFEGAEDTAVFRLVRRVTINPDVWALPPFEIIFGSIRRAIDEINPENTTTFGRFSSPTYL